MDYKKKYNKYKSKYLNIKKILGGSNNSMPSMPEEELYINQNHQFYRHPNHIIRTFLI